MSNANHLVNNHIGTRIGFVKNCGHAVGIQLKVDLCKMATQK